MPQWVMHSARSTLAAPLCATCGTQYAPSQEPPHACVICADERQWVPESGQPWTSLEWLRARYENTWTRLEPHLYAIRTEPSFAIGQRALLLRSPGGNVLWDCIALLDDTTIDLVQALGGLHGIAISHPHYYTTMIEWAHAFDVPVHLHADDREWVVRHDPAIRFWEGETLPLHDDITLIRTGGHFEGATVLHWPAGAEGRGALLSGDVIAVVQDRRHVTFMRSFPNYIPLAASSVRRIAGAVEPYPFENVWGAFAGREILGGGSEGVQRSAERYIRWLGDDSGTM